MPAYDPVKKIKEAKKSKKKKPKLKTRKTCEANLDRYLSTCIRVWSADKNGMVQCYTCPVKKFWKEMHCCHFIKRACRRYRRDIDNLVAGCPGCNMYNEADHMKVYTMKLIKEHGADWVENRYLLSKELYKIPIRELRELEEKWHKKYKEVLEIAKGFDTNTQDCNTL